METILIATRSSVVKRSCQIHGEESSQEVTFVKYKLPSGKIKTDQLIGFNYSENDIINILRGHPKNLINYSFEFIDWKYLS